MTTVQLLIILFCVFGIAFQLLFLHDSKCTKYLENKGWSPVKIGVITTLIANAPLTILLLIIIFNLK